MKIELAGAAMELLAERAIYWPSQSTLIVADLHLGKAHAFRYLGVPVPSATSSVTLARITELLNTTAARRLVVLGDFWHARTGKTPDLLASIDAWREQHAAVQIDLVLGNHDHGCGQSPGDWRICEHRLALVEPPFAFCHFPREHENAYTLAGHVHPAIALRGAAQQSLRLPCFWFGARVGVLPAFGEFTGAATIDAQAGDGVYAIADDEVVCIARLKVQAR